MGTPEIVEDLEVGLTSSTTQSHLIKATPVREDLSDSQSQPSMCSEIHNVK